MKFNNKKTQGRSFWIIVTMIIALVVVVLVILWFRAGGEKGFDFIGKKIGELEDTDKDGVADMFDVCEGEGEEGKVDSKGCPIEEEKREEE